MSERIWPRRRVLPLPDAAYGDTDVKRLLTEEPWKLNTTPTDADYEKTADLTTWEDIALPRQIDAKTDKEYLFARDITIPESFASSRTFLHFDGVNCYARVFVDGTYLGDHYGGFVSWDLEITEAVKAGENHRLVIGVTDKPNDISEFHRGGIIREIYLERLPQQYLTRLHADTTFDAAYNDAELKVYTAVEADAPVNVKLSLTDPKGITSELGTVTYSGKKECCTQKMHSNYGPNQQEQETVFTVPSPLKWDSEHPWLYTLTAVLTAEDGTVLEETHRRVGFRVIERRGNVIYVNNQELKLHGINHHDTHPETGRSITPEISELDVTLFHEANINFIRTSHYPPRPDFLDFCDEQGIYVEDETAVAFLGQGTPCRENDPQFTDKFMNPFSELIERDRSHPCVILWSLANESIWGFNFDLENKYAHQDDPSRLTIFSYPITQQEDDDRADVWSMHYAAWDQDPLALVDSFNRSEHEPVEWPVLHDESTHIPCYCRKDLRRDPGVRDFYGETIAPFYDKLFHTPGALGCAIWAGIDEERKGARFTVPWGIIDGYRRRKPEFWHVRKAYSPVVVLGQPYESDGFVAIDLENRFNHTNLSEVTFSWRVTDAGPGAAGCISCITPMGEAGEMKGPQAAPHTKGTLVIPVLASEGIHIRVDVYDAFHKHVSEEELIYQPAVVTVPALSGSAPMLTEDENTVTISAEDFEVVICKETGLIVKAVRAGETVLTGGPYLHLTGLALAPWKLTSLQYCLTDTCAKIVASGAYDRVKVTFVMQIDAAGLLETVCTIDDMPYASPRKVAMRVGDDTDSGGYEETGISFTVPAALDTLTWKRQGQWTVYPDWHIGRLEGAATKHPAAGEKGYKDDERDISAFGVYDPGVLGTRDFRSLKSYITEAALKNEKSALTVFSDGTDSVRAKILPPAELTVQDTDARLTYEGEWTTVNTKYRSANSTETWSNHKGDRCTLKFEGTGCIFVSSEDILGGFAAVYVDGQLMADRINLGNRQLTPGIARGYEKDWGRMMYSVKDLPYGEHELTVEVTGESIPGAMNTYVFIDHFVILREGTEGETCLMIDSAFNYPELSWGDYTKPPVQMKNGDAHRYVVKI